VKPTCKAACAKLPVGDLPGIGPVAEKRLRELRIATIGGLQDATPEAPGHRLLPPA